ncbi:PAS domain-containing sensor histidine kinase [Caldimonas thermodepolymerans]|uniref:PAS/PAC sensor signal transduction histidine kinase n=1 Tax=Caldimonas thermodepolymerans TaxID=215580 RepID=A0AA46DC65_9BURK|nr:PAS domain-containing sensor histidine kinase [Caldimonas thermodepolymerans]TCP04933.1 PAS/PAC sensor signal transduction histidine kinase [Caldimonas thermodepolymerans]UZG48308.1 PAS domain-containing sensor histidine kinase [Caldimonas thermodepolymerans]
MHEAGAATPSAARAVPAPGRLWEDRLRLLLESTGEGIYGVDVTGRCMFINRAGARMLGYEPHEVLDRDMHQLVHHTHGDGTHYPSEDCPIYNAFRRGVPCRVDDEVLWRRDGSCFYVEYSSYPIFEGGQVQGAVVTFVDITERRRAAELLRQTNDELECRVAERTRELSDALAQLRKLSAYLERVREDERTRIAREIHDELGSLLVALKMDVAWLARRVEDRPTLHAKCGAMSYLIETAVENVGRIITDLRPSILDHQGLWAALEWQAQEFAQNCELQCDWRIDVEPGLPPLPQQLANAVFRIFQELLSNVARHAQASAVRIRIEARGGCLRLEVADNGRGAPVEAFESAQAYGVLGMRERAGHHGGRLRIDSTPGQGTRVELVLPLPGTTLSDFARLS